MLSDIEIAQNTQMKPVIEIAELLGILPDELELYGKYKAKLAQSLYSRMEGKPDGHLVLVTAVNPTPAGEGKTTTTVGLGQAMQKIGKKAVIALREPSLGPVFGMKGGAAGGGYAQVLPMEDINLHFTGDMHAVTAANNLLCALLDNHIHQGNTLGIDPRSIFVKRCVDMNDRSLRNILIGLGGKINGVPREDGFMITVASEVMAILCLASDIQDLKERLSRIIVARTFDGRIVTAKELKAEGAMAALLKDAINPNLVQTLEGTPALMHGGPFANIAHGCNSVRATKIALKLADYCITEAGFGSDLGAEKFFNIKCRYAELKPSAAVLVATVRALKYNGGASCAKSEISNEDIEALKSGIENLGAHIDNIRQFGVPVIVAINRFYTDTDAELRFIEEYCKEKKADFALSEVFAKGGDGGVHLARKLVSICEKSSSFVNLYDMSASIKNKIETVAKKVYGAGSVVYTNKAQKALREAVELGGDKMPVCIAKTQYSLSDDPKLLGRPENFEITVKDIKVAAGAGFNIVFTGDIMTMPGLPKIPSAEKIEIDESGKISGLF